MGRVVDPKAFGDLVIATRNGVPIRVRDIGWAEDGTREQRSIARLNGVPTVTLGAGQNAIHTVDEWVDLTDFVAGCRLAVALATN